LQVEPNSDRAARTNGKARLLAGASVLAALLASGAPAAAQGSASPTLDKEVSLDTVVVTARRREEKLIDVPVAANVVPRATLEKYATTDFIQLQTLVPGVQIARTGGGTPGATVRIRGIGVFGPDYSSEQPVSLVIDGVPVSRGHIADIGFLDQAGIQVLKGPQALFFGKNSPAGVIAIDSVTPGNQFEGYLRASYGFRSEDPVVEGAVTLPVNPTLSIRLAGRVEDMQGGYITNTAKPVAVSPIPDPSFGGKPTPLPGAAYDKYPKTKQYVARLSVAWKPTDRFDVVAKVLSGYTHYDSSYAQAALQCGGDHLSYISQLTQVRYIDQNSVCKLDQITNDALPAAPVLNNYLGAPPDHKFFRSAAQTLGSVAANLRLDQVTFTSITGYYDVEAKQFDNYDQTVFAETPGAQREQTTFFTQEFRAVTNLDGPVNFTAGAYYEHESRKLDQSNRIFVLGPFPAGVPGEERYAGITNSMINLDHNHAKTYSVFGQVSWKIIPTVELAGGARYTKSTKDADLNVLMQVLDQLFLAAPGGPFAASSLAPAGTRYAIHTSYSNVSPEVTLSWKPRSNMLIYGAYKTGFLAGGIGNPGVLSNYSDQRGYTQAQRTSILTFAPEKTKGYELGLKGDFLDSRLTGDLTFFNYKFEGVQIATINPATATFTVGNAASARDRGVEVNSAFRVTDNLTLRAAASYVDLKFIKYAPAPCYPGQPLTAAPGCALDPTNVKLGKGQDLSGTRFGTAPLSTSFGFTYAAPLNDRFDISVSGDVQSYTRSPPLNRQPGSQIPGYSLFNATARLSRSGGAWAVSLIGTNLTDKTYLNTISTKPLGDPNDLTGTPGLGREVRLQLDYKF